MRVQVLGAIDTNRFERLRAGCAADSFDDPSGPEVVFVWAQRRDELAQLLAAHGAGLRWVHFRRVGIGADILGLFESYPHIVLTNGSGASGIAVAEHTLMLMLALTKRLPETMELQRQRTWVWGFDVAELHGQTACIVGLGDVGRSIARLLRALGVTCLGIRRRAQSIPDVDHVYTSLDDAGVLERAQWLILAAPLNASTRSMIGAAELARLANGAYVINVGRGQLIDEAALIDSLQAGHVAGAGLDVVSTEPLPETSPLWSMPNVIVTPHSAAHTSETDDRSVDLFVRKLVQFRRGDALENRIDIGSRIR